MGYSMHKDEPKGNWKKSDYSKPSRDWKKNDGKYGSKYSSKDEPKGYKGYSSKDEPKHEPSEHDSKGYKPSKPTSTTDHPTHSTTSKPTTTTAYSTTSTAHPTTSTAHQTTTTAHPTYILTAQTDYSSKDEPKDYKDDHNMKPKHDEPSKDYDDDHSSKDNDGNYGVAYSGQSCSDPDQCSTGCCEDDVCVAKKKDWTNFFMYCPAECVGQIFGKRGTC